jgi:hypothetical protein
LCKALNVPFHDHHAGARQRFLVTAKITVAVGTALAAVAVNCKPQIIAREVVGVRLAVDEQRMQGKDGRSPGIDEQASSSCDAISGLSVDLR